MGDHRLLKYIILGSLCVVMLLGIAQDSWGATADQAQVMDAIQEQIIAFRKEFKLQIERAEEDRHAIYKNLQQKFSNLMEKQTSANEFQPELSKKIKELLPLLESYGQQIDKLELMLDDIEVTMDENLKTVETQLVVAKEVGIQGIRPSSSIIAPPIEEAEAAPDKSGPLDLAPGKLFRLAYRFYTDGEYEVAIGGFQKYLADYPNTQLSGAAQYWIAEAFAKLEEYDIAFQEYHRLLNTYPQDAKVADAHYGIGSVLLKLGNAGEAQAKFRYVLDHFGGTIAAKKAQRRVDEGR